MRNERDLKRKSEKAAEHRRESTHKPVEPAALGLKLAKDVVVRVFLQAPAGACKDQVCGDANGHSPVAQSFIQGALVQFLGNPEKKVVGVEERWVDRGSTADNHTEAAGQLPPLPDSRIRWFFIRVISRILCPKV